MVKIAVLGAGINGLACAVKIKEKYKDFQVTLISNEFSPNTTGDGSGGLWYPYLCGTTSHTLIAQWGGETYDFLYELWKANAVKISFLPIYDLYAQKENFKEPDWRHLVYGYQELDIKQLEDINQRYSSKYVAGLSFTTFVVTPPSLLAYFRNRFEQADGEIIHAMLTSLEDPMLQEFDVIVNCTGLGARYLVPDEKVLPIRGQIMRVEAPWIKEVIIDDLSNYIIPGTDFCVLGGTHQDSYNTEVDSKDMECIFNNCKKLIPSLKDAEVVNHWVGLRPGRDSIRLEPEEINGKLRIHNYGHGGSGFTLFWGCSNEVLRILEKYLNKNSHSTSKL